MRASLPQREARQRRKPSRWEIAPNLHKRWHFVPVCEGGELIGYDVWAFHAVPDQALVAFSRGLDMSQAWRVSFRRRLLEAKFDHAVSIHGVGNA